MVSQLALLPSVWFKHYRISTGKIRDCVGRYQLAATGLIRRADKSRAVLSVPAASSHSGWLHRTSPQGEAVVRVCKQGAALAVCSCRGVCSDHCQSAACSVHPQAQAALLTITPASWWPCNSTWKLEVARDLRLEG